MVNSLPRQTPKRWQWFLLRRIVSHFVLGALCAAIVGALCIGTAGGLCGWILDLRSQPASWDDGFTVVGALLGATLGSYSGVVGAFFGLWSGIAAPPSRSVLPPRALLQSLALGQIAGTLVACSTFFLWEVFQAQNTGLSFGRTVEQDIVLILWGAPALMICGAIVGALFRPAGSPGAGT